jgi:hypothetical protein
MPSHVIAQRISNADKSLKNCLLNISNLPVDVLFAVMTAGAAKDFISCIAGFAVRSGKTIPSQTKLPS